MKRDWNRAGLSEITTIVSNRSFDDYGDDDLEAMIVRCDGCSLGGDPVIVKQTRINKESLQRVLDQRREEADRKLREAAESERHKQRTALENEKLGQLTGIKGEVTKIGGHVENLDNRVTGIDGRLARNERHVEGIHKEAKRATLIGLVAVALALVIPFLGHFGCLGQREADANQNASQSRGTTSLSNVPPAAKSAP